MSIFDKLFSKKQKHPEGEGLVPGIGRLPYPAYRGREPYLFLSYAHLDADIVLEEVKP